MGTEGITPEQLVRWPASMRESAEADERLYNELLAGRAPNALSYDEMRDVCEGFAAIDPETGKKIRRLRARHHRYCSAWNRIRRAQTLDTLQQWDSEEYRRSVEAAAAARALKSHTPETLKEFRARRRAELRLPVQRDPRPAQQHRPR